MTNLLPPPSPPPLPPSDPSTDDKSASKRPALDPRSTNAIAAPPPFTAEPDPKLEIEWQNAVRNLERQVKIYEEVRHMKDSRVLEDAAENVAQAMEDVGNTHTDPNVKRYWKERAATFRAGGQKEREGMLEEVGKGILMLLTTPFFLVGAVLQAAGGILHGVGKILKGIGMVAGMLSHKGESSTGN